MPSGQVRKMIATDRGAITDMQAFADPTGNTLMSAAEENGEYLFLMKKK